MQEKESIMSCSVVRNSTLVSAVWGVTLGKPRDTPQTADTRVEFHTTLQLMIDSYNLTPSQPKVRKCMF